MKSTIILFLILFIFNNIPAMELDLQGWERKVGNDTPDQKIISFTKYSKIDDREFKSIILQIRNGVDWHWSQDFYIKEGVGDRYLKIAWNVMANDGKDLLRWYTYGNIAHCCMVFGVGEKVDVEGIGESQKYLRLTFMDPNNVGSTSNVIFVEKGDGIFNLYVPNKIGNNKF